jgi:hypothetical protein
MKRTRKKTKNNPRRHPFSPLAHPTFAALLVCCLLGAAVVSAGAGEQHKKRRGPADDFLIFGTVFTGQGFALPGARIEVRRSGEKKISGRAVSDRRGEFGIRVPAGAEYDVRIEAKGFARAERKVDGKIGMRFDFVERMEPEAPAAAKNTAGEKKP